MILVFLSVAVLLCLFVSIVNYFYQRQKYKYSTDEEMKSLSLFESPATWRICIILSALMLVGTIVICSKFVMGGLSNMETQQNTINQYQNDSSYENTENGQAN
ncbi:MAG: hypothetical protein N2484_07670 [Clostridia bacterium]|nr:hypothetical protein [Clostridia bacterium]